MAASSARLSATGAQSARSSSPRGWRGVGMVLAAAGADEMYVNPNALTGCRQRLYRRASVPGDGYLLERKLFSPSLLADRFRQAPLRLRSERGRQGGGAIIGIADGLLGLRELDHR
jgi:hypothetical protein